MAQYKNFVQSIWSKKIMDALEIECKLVQNCNRDYEGDVKQAASVKILGVGEPTIRKYDSKNDIVIEDMKDEGQMLYIDQANYFAFYVDDVDKAQSVPGLAEEYQRKSVHGLAVERDTYVANLIRTSNYKESKDEEVVEGKSYYIKQAFTFAKVENPTGNPCELGLYEMFDNVSVADNLTQESVKEAIDAAIVALRDRHFAEAGVIELSPEVYNVFKNCLITLSTNNPDYIKRGIVGMYDGFEVIMSTNMVKDTTHRYCDIRGKKAISFAGQINEVEALRAQNKFKDIVRGLDTFGAKTTDNERIQVIKVPLKKTA